MTEEHNENKVPSFVSRVRDVIVDAAKDYRNYFVNYEYLICSDAFVKRPYYIVSAHEDNFLHLTGVGTSLGAREFYQKCIDGTLEEEDIGFDKKNQSAGEVKGSVRRKIKLLPYLAGILDGAVEIEEDFSRNKVQCSFAVGDDVLTLGFWVVNHAVPKTLLKGNELNPEKAAPIAFLARRPSGESKFSQILVSDEEAVNKYLPTVRHMLTDELIESLKPPKKESGDASEKAEPDEN